MLMMVTNSEDGARIRFYSGIDELETEFRENEERPSAWLTPEQAAEDPNYWPEGSVFLAEVTPLRMEPEQVAVSWRMTKQS